MSELRLVPAAATVWAATLIAIVYGIRPATVLVVAIAAAALMARQPGHAMLTAGLGACTLAVTWARIVAAQARQIGNTVIGTVSGTPRDVTGGGWVVNVSVSGYPVPVPVFTEDVPDSVAAGSPVEVSGQVGESSRPGVGTVVINGDVSVLGPPTGFAAWAGAVREKFASAVECTVGEHSQGLIPGMVLGDVSLQSATEQQAYVDTGLSHLSAVSGANCMYVATAALLAARLMRAGLRLQLITAGCALLVYAGLVGPEPSVLRASVSGLVGFVAVISSTRAEPIHALCLSVIGLVLVDSDLAVDYAFALSVAATAGIVAVAPLFYRLLAPLGWPDIVNRALSVALAADLATAPIIAAMVGQVSVVSVLANVLVSPVTGAVTVLGMAAAILAQIHTGLAAPVLWIIAPMAGWIRTVAEVGSGMPGTTVGAAPLAVVVFYGWVIAGFWAGRPRLTMACGVAVMASAVITAAWGATGGQDLRDVETLHAHVVNTEEEVEPVPPGTQLVVVLDPAAGEQTRPVFTRGGIPVIYPGRDGLQ
nr:ComEC family competence protein [Streptococcus thermophilus]